MNDHNSILEYYLKPGMMTDPGAYAGMLAGAPVDVAALVKVVQGNLLHIFWAERYGRPLSKAEKQTVGVRPLAHKLALMQQVDPRPLVEVRTLQQRQVGNCRDFTLLLTALLKLQGIPARARCGFAAYFLPGHYEDHWVCEYWNVALQRWVLVDAQMDYLQREVLELSFDPLDTPRDRFIIAGQSWQVCRQGAASPDQFGIFDMNGWWFIWGNVVRDFLALCRLEILPWDHEFGVFTHPLEDPFPDDPAEVEFYDQIAALTVAGDAAFDEIQRIYAGDTRWRHPAGWGE